MDPGQAASERSRSGQLKPELSRAAGMPNVPNASQPARNAPGRRAPGLSPLAYSTKKSPARSSRRAWVLLISNLYSRLRYLSTNSPSFCLASGGIASGRVIKAPARALGQSHGRSGVSVVRQVTHSLLSHLGVPVEDFNHSIHGDCFFADVPDIVIGHMSHHGITYLGFARQESLRRGSHSDDGHPPGAEGIRTRLWLKSAALRS